MSRFLRHRTCLIGAIGALIGLLGGTPAPASPWPPDWRVAQLTGDALACLLSHTEDEVEVVACRDVCAPIPWQLDERDDSGALALPDGPQPNPDNPPGVIDANDELLWMAADAGRQMRPDEAPRAAVCGLTVALRGPAATAWVYAFALRGPAPRSPIHYVAYDAGRDAVRAGRVTVGFGASTPRLLALREADGSDGPNLLDRLKIRAAARFLGLIPLSRDEDDIAWDFVAWHAGPIRVVRRERQWVRLGWGLRTPIFRSETLVSRDAVELPVHLRLNFPPSYFFGGIEVQAALDFRDLRGWTVETPQGRFGAVGALPAELRTGINALDGDWLALSGPDITLVLRLQLGETLASLRRQILYREDEGGYAPEAVPGEHPAVGFRLTEWGHVDRGEHWFAATAIALPPGVDAEQFARDDAEPLTISSRPFPDAGR